MRKSGSSIDTGWSGEGAAFGPSHEFGYKKSSWPVKPVGIRITAKKRDKKGRFLKGGGTKVIGVLRFRVGGKIVYSRGHTVSKPAPQHIKPHFVPAYEAYPVEARMGKALDRAVERAGL